MAPSLFIATDRFIFENTTAAQERGVEGSSPQVNLVECVFTIGC